MNKPLVIAAVLAACSLSLSAQEARTAPEGFKKIGFGAVNMDRSADPCVDFYQYSCGAWIQQNPVPGDRPGWGRFDDLFHNNEALLHDILEKAAADRPGRTAVEQKIGDYYAACMDEKLVESRGLEPLRPDLERIAALKDKRSLPALVADLQGVDIDVLFGFGVIQDFKDSNRAIATTAQGGMGLPSRDYYLQEDPQSVEIRKQYLAYLQKVLELLGDSPEKAAAGARTVLQLETDLAKGALSPVEMRDPNKLDHMMTVAELQAFTPSFDWKTFLTKIGLPEIKELNVMMPEFMKQMDGRLAAVPLGDWKTYLRTRLATDLADVLPAPFVNAEFAFFGGVLSGTQEIRPRWKRCIEATDEDLGEALGQKYVEVAFGEENRRRMDELVKALIRALDRDIRDLDWMGDATEKEALTKLARISTKIGYPKTWRDYSSLRVVRGDALGNWKRAAEFESRRQISKVGRPVDRLEWLVTPPTVNAYYMPPMNDISFPAGILQPPFFDVTLDDAVNFGAIGAVIGHELTHGFDDQGRKFDAEGNLRDWWTPEDSRKFEERVACVDKQYSGYTAVGDVKVNGKLTLGENTADLGGLRIAYMALQDVLGGKKAAPRDGFTSDQRFFLGWAQIWCENNQPEYSRQLALTNPHSPGRYRVNGVVSNMPEFRQAFDCKVGQPMAPQNACRVW